MATEHTPESTQPTGPENPQGQVLGEAASQSQVLFDSLMAETIRMAMHEAVRRQSPAELKAAADATSIHSKILSVMGIKQAPPAPDPELP